MDTFNIWSVHFAEHEVGGQTVRERHMLRFHPIFIRNYVAQYLKGLDADFYWSLRSPVSKRLYRLVDLQRSGGLVWQTDLLAIRDQVPLDYYYPSQIKRALQKAQEELVDRNFLSEVKYEGKTRVLYRVSREFDRRQKARELSGDPKEIFAIERLIGEGIYGDTARELVVTRGPDRCLLCADAVNSQKGVRGRTGWVIAAIKEGWTIRSATQATLQGSLPKIPKERVSPSPQGNAEPPSRPVPPKAEPAAQQLWGAVLEDLSERTDSPSLHVWFEGAIPVSLRNEALTLAVPNSVAEEYIESRFRLLIEESLRRRLPGQTALRIEVVGKTGGGIGGSHTAKST